MRRLLNLVFVALTFAVLFLARPAVAVIAVSHSVVSPGTIKTVQGKLDLGTTVDLAWAARSSVACFPATQNDRFSGNHVLFSVDLPARSEIVISATPGSPSQALSLYGYTVAAADTTTIPPNVSSSVACEASYATTTAATYSARSIKLVATTTPYKVYVGVAGASATKTGNFSLSFDLKTAAAAPTGKVASATKIAVAPSSTKSVIGKIDGGPQIDLAWAASSAVACFPATQNTSFDGAHVVYAVDLPAYSELTAVVAPVSSSVDLNLYGYTVSSTDTTSLPPNVSSVVSCEASGGTSANPGQAETIKLIALKNPYRAYIGVAGSQKTTSGGFNLKISLKSTQ